MARFEGDDYVNTIRGTEDADIIRGRGNADRLYGNGGDDRIFGDDGRDLIYGGDGHDRLYGGEGDDQIFGGAGDDVIYGGDSSDAGFEFLRGEDGDDIIYGEGGRDAINGGNGDDRLYGGSGNDVLTGGAGTDLVDGGTGIDIVNFSDPTAIEGLIVNLATQKVKNDGFGNVERLISIEGILTLNLTADRLVGDDGANTIEGGRGDVLQGLGGDDVLTVRGVAGTTIDGGNGSDEVVVLDAMPIATNTSAAASDPSGFEWAYADQPIVIDLSRQKIVNDGFGSSARLASIEHASMYTTIAGSQIIGNDGANRLSGSGQLIGAGGDDILTGADVSDVLNGGDGDDILIGGGDVDRLIGGSGADIFRYEGGYIVYRAEYWERGYFPYDFGSGIDDVPERIRDFNLDEGDRIDLSEIDAILEVGPNPHDAFTFIGTAPFSGHGAEVRYQAGPGLTTLIQVDVAVDVGDPNHVDLSILVPGRLELTADAFIL